MSTDTQRHSASYWRYGIVVFVGLLLVGPQVASADTYMLMMDRGKAKKKVMAELSGQLKDAGHKSMVTGASLEDSALMLGCDPKDDSCLDMVIETHDLHDHVGVLDPREETVELGDLLGGVIFHLRSDLEVSASDVDLH